MGNGNSKTSQNDTNTNTIHTIKQLVDDVALKYILTMNFESFAKLQEREYCDKLVILTSKIIEDKLNQIEITYLANQNKNQNKNKNKNCNIFFIYYVNNI